MWFEIIIANWPFSPWSVPGCEFLCVSVHFSEIHCIHSKSLRHLVFGGVVMLRLPRASCA